MMDDASCPGLPWPVSPWRVLPLCRDCQRFVRYADADKQTRRVCITPEATHDKHEWTCPNKVTR